MSVSVTTRAVEFPLTEDSKPQPGVPQGEVRGPFPWKSKIYPGTVRDYWVYVPKQYDPAKKACLLVVQDGLPRAKGWHVPTVLDNMIHKGEVPVQIGVFINPGQTPAPRKGASPRPNRSFEYDSLGDRYARFLIEEMLPEVKKSYNISDDPDDSAIAGSSSGGICAFNAAWERPERFNRVFSAIGSFSALRGGDVFPTLIRKHEARPLRVFLQDGSNDVNAYTGDLFLVHKSMLSALKYLNYDVEHAWGEGGHDDKHAAQILPDVFRFLWKGYPARIEAPERPSSFFHVNIPINGEDWESVNLGGAKADSVAANAAGEVFFADRSAGRIHKIDRAGTVSVFANDCPNVTALACGADGTLYACEQECIVRLSKGGEKELLAEGIRASSLALLRDGGGFFSDSEHGALWRFAPRGEAKVVDTKIAHVTSVVVLKDESLLWVADALGRFTHSFQIQDGGELANGEPYGWMQLDSDATESGVGPMAVDSKGRIYVATSPGIQILDDEGRMALILRPPLPRVAVSGMAFAGQNGDLLHAATDGRLFRRRLKQ